MRISPTTSAAWSRDGTNYQAILDAVRRYRCEQQLAINWVPARLAWDLGYARSIVFIELLGDGLVLTTAK